MVDILIHPLTISDEVINSRRIWFQEEGTVEEEKVEVKKEAVEEVVEGEDAKSGEE